MSYSEQAESVSKALIARLADEDVLESGFPECTTDEIKTFCNPVNGRCYICCMGAFGLGWNVLIDSDTGQSVECSSSKTIVVNTQLGERVLVRACSIVSIE